MKSLRLPIFLLALTFFMIFLNFLALMKLIPIFITMPLLFISIYLTLSSFTHRQSYRSFRQRL